MLSNTTSRCRGSSRMSNSSIHPAINAQALYPRPHPRTDPVHRDEIAHICDEALNLVNMISPMIGDHGKAGRYAGTHSR